MGMVEYDQIERVNGLLKKTDIKGKDYIEVNQRIKGFKMLYPEGFIHTQLVSMADGICVMTAEVGYYENGEKRILGTGTAYEKESSTFINKTSYVENCVPLDSEILTEYGWAYYYQLRPGMKVLSMNMETQQVEYCKLERINIYKDTPIVEMKTKRFKARCTQAHKWVVRGQHTPLCKKETRDILRSEKIVQNIRQDVKPSDIGKKLGWLMCDCEIARTENGMPSTAYISQSKHVEYVKNLFGEPRKLKKYKDEWMDCYEWVIPAELVRDILGYFGISTYEDLPKAMLQANIEDVAGCYEAMMLADGENRGFSSTYRDLVDAVQIMCARLGIATGHIKTRMMKNSTKPIHTLSIKKTDGAYFSEMEKRMLPPTDVWCPTTENGTWFMRQGDFVTLTSNCETSAVGRALGMAGIGIDTSVASAEEVTNAINNQEQIKEAEKQEKIRKEKIKDVHVKALESKCENDGVAPGFICDLYKVKTFKDLTNEMFRNITDNWDKIMERSKG